MSYRRCGFLIVAFLLLPVSGFAQFHAPGQRAKSRPSLNPYTNPISITGTRITGADAINNVNWNGLIDPRTYGVKCDGSTDDTANLQTALNSLAGAHVVLPPNKVCVIAGTLTVGSATMPATLDLTGSRLSCTGTAGNDCIEIAQFGHLTCDGYGSGAANNGCQISSTSTSNLTSLVTNADHSTPQTNFDLRRVLIAPNPLSTVTKGALWIFALEGSAHVDNVHILPGPNSSLRVESGVTGNLLVNNLSFIDNFYGCGASANPCVYFLSGGLFFSNITFIGGAIVDATGSGPLLSIQGGSTGKLRSVLFDGTYFESKAGGTGDFIDVGDAQNITFNGVDFNGGPTLPNCLKITQAALGNVGNVRLFARTTGGQCTNYINNTITSYVSTTAGDLNYIYQGNTNPVATNVIDGPQIFNNTVAINKTLSTYNNITTVSDGLSYEVAKADATAQAANIAATTLHAVPATGAGKYRISCYVVETQAATTSSTLPQCAVNWTDKDSGVAESAVNVTNTNTANAVGATGLGAAGSFQGAITIYAAASTNIQYSTTGYASAGATPMLYAIHARVERLGS